jgi:hypothetical protein
VRLVPFGVCSLLRSGRTGSRGVPWGCAFVSGSGQVDLAMGYRFRASELLIPSALRTIRHLDTPGRHTGEHIGTADSVPSMTKGRPG